MLEPEPPEGAGTSEAGGDAAQTSGATAPIGTLSKLALKDAIHELEATVRRTAAVSSAAAQQLWQSAEKRLGLEVAINDPALRELFGLHVIAVEDLCVRVRSHAEATLAAAEEFGRTDLGSTAAWLQPLELSDAKEPGSDEALEFELLDASRAATVARTRLESRLREEVLDVLDRRLEVHAQVREDLRESQRCSAAVEMLRRDVAHLKKGSAASGLRALSGRSSSVCQEEANARLLEALHKVGEVDSRVLSALLEMQAGSVDAVRRPWAALLQISAEYFMAQQALWGPLGAAFQDCAGSDPEDEQEQRHRQQNCNLLPTDSPPALGTAQ